MNFLYISKSELLTAEKPLNDASQKAILANTRASEAIKDHALKPGLQIACVAEGQGRGKVLVGNCSSEQVELEFQIEAPLPPRVPIDLVVAYSRPQTIKKILHLASSSGLRSLSFVKTENVVPSYLQSKTLASTEIQRHLVLGCEQSGDGIFPQINFFKCFDDFLSSNLVINRTQNKFYGEATEEVSPLRESNKNALIMLGPESGFTLIERRELDKGGFTALSLGPRVLRLEVAAAMFIGQLL